MIPSSLCKPQKELESSPKNNPTSSKENQPEKDLVKRNYVSVKEETKQVKNILTQSHIDCKPNSVLSNPLNQREGLSYEEMKKKMNEFSDVDAKNGINFRLTNVKQFAKLMGYPNFDENTRIWNLIFLLGMRFNLTGTYRLYIGSIFRIIPVLCCKIFNIRYTDGEHGS